MSECLHLRIAFANARGAQKPNVIATLVCCRDCGERFFVSIRPRGEGRPEDYQLDEPDGNTAS